jgi:hypothetical protein
VQLNPEAIEQASWANRDVEIIPAPLDRYVEGLRRAVDELYLGATA